MQDDDNVGMFSLQLGNDKIHQLTRHYAYKLRIELEDFEGEMRYAEYQWFRVGNEDTNYALEVSGYSGSAGQYQ